MNEEKHTAIEVRPEKHIMIDNAISDMDKLIARANDVLNKIRGTNEPEAPSPEHTQPNLSSVLVNAPEEIREKTSRLHDILNKIDEELF